jgi:hypothetical protein
MHFAEHYGANSTWTARRLPEERDAHLALLVGDLAYAMCVWPLRLCVCMQCCPPLASTRLQNRTATPFASTMCGGCSISGWHVPALFRRGYGADWDWWGAQFEPAFRSWPMAVGTGNHERDWPGTGDAFKGTSRDSGGWLVLELEVLGCVASSQYCLVCCHDLTWQLVVWGALAMCYDCLFLCNGML